MRLALLLCCVIGGSARLLAAQEPAVLRGTVRESPSGAPVPGAEIRLGAARSFSDSLGRWSLTARGTAPFVVTARRPGFAARGVDAWPGTDVIILLEPLPVALETIVVTASRREQKLKDVVPETEVVSRRQIDATGASDVAGALTQATGLQLEGGVPAGAGVYLQGLDSRRVLVLLDGQPLAGRLNGNFDLSRLPASMIEQVEIVRGPQSTLYGSDAMGGVVNIISRAPTPGLGVSASLDGGTQDRRALAAAVRGTTGRMGIVLDGGARTEALAPGRPGDDATMARRWHAAPRLRWRAGPSADVELSGLVIGERQRYRTGQLFHFSDNTQAGARLSLVHQRGVRRLAPTVSWSRYEHLSRAATGDQPASDSGAVDVQQIVQGEVTWSLPVPAMGVADVGIVARHESVEADRVAGRSRSLSGAESYAQATWTRGAVSVTPGVRLSTHEQWGRALTPRVAALWRPSAALGIRAAAGAGYRAPDFKELYYDFANTAAGYAVRGNPDLRPERSTSASLGVELTAARGFARAGAFLTRFKDFIDYGSPDASGTYTPGNIASGSTRGLDLEAGWTMGLVQLEAGYALLRARDDEAASPLLGRAPRSGRVSASAAIGRARLSSVLRVTGRTPVARDANGALTYRDAWARLDARAAVTVNGSLEMHAAVENLFDRRMDASWPGYTGRRVAAGIRLATH